MLKKIKNITVFGGGTSGWLTVAYLTNNLNVPTKITLIEDASKGPIGVGEGTQPFTSKFLSRCNIFPNQWMKPSNASFKYGVELIGWNNEPYFVDNDNLDNAVLAHDYYTSDYFLAKSKEEYFDWYPSYNLAKKNICQKFDDYLDINFQMGPWDFGAVHFSAYDIIDAIKEKVLEKITYVDTKIVDVKTNENGIEKLVDDIGQEYTADLFIDCSGFESILLEKNLKSPFTSYKPWLANDSAVAMPTQYTNPQEECHPYTKATTMTSGWRWTIPTYHRIGNGYVYSSDFISADQAETELRQSLNDFDTPVKHLKMKTGYHKEIAVKNVCAVGLAAGFVEPLEATGITFTTAIVEYLTEQLNYTGNVWSPTSMKHINSKMRGMSDEILAFVWAHYYYSSRNDTEYWKAVRNQGMETLPEGSLAIIQSMLPVPKRYFMYSQDSMFSVCQWFSMLKAGGAYDTAESYLTEKQERYGKYFTSAITNKLELAEDFFQNHYDYLKEWYGE